MSGEHPWLRPEDIESLCRLLDRDVRNPLHIVHPAELARWMDADDRFARYVEDHYPELAERARVVPIEEAS